MAITGPASRRLVAALAGCAACIYTLPGLLAHWHFRTNYDLAIFDQGIWHLSRFEAPASTIRGLTNLLGDHFSPILALVAPLYWVAPAPEVLIVLQGCLFAASILPVFAFLRRRIPDAQALALCVAYALFWGLQRAAAFDFHEIAFAPLLIALVVLAIDTRRWGLLWAAAGGLLLVKEDLLPFLACAGIYLVLIRERRQGVILLAASVLAFWVIVGHLVPYLNDRGGYDYAGTFTEVRARPWLLPARLVTPPAKLTTVLMWLAPFGFLPLFSPIALLAVPFALSRFLSALPNHWSTVFHYWAPLAPILAMAAGDGLARLARRVGDDRLRKTIVRAVLAVAVLFALVLPGRQPVFRLFRASNYRSTPFLESGRRALRLVPQGASVVAQTAIAPHLAHRPVIHHLTETAPDADVVIAAAGLSPWPLPDEAALWRLVDARRSRGYVVVFDENGWVVLERR